MRATFPASKFLATVKTTQFWLLAIAAGLIAIHLTLSGRDDDVSSQAIGTLYWLAASFLVWQKRHRLILESGLISSLTGVLLIVGVIVRSTSLPSTNFLSVFPFLSGLGLGLLASGKQSFKQYWREWTILFFFGVPKVLLSPLINISTLTAQFATFILWYSGFNAQRQGTQILLPVDGVNVIASCSGFNSMFYLLGLAVTFLLLFPLAGFKKNVLVLSVAVSLGFIVNGFRVALLALLADARNQQGLEYWHTGQGSLLFPMVAVVLFGLFCLILRQHQLAKHLAVER